jgi:hypothetical protein
VVTACYVIDSSSFSRLFGALESRSCTVCTHCTPAAVFPSVTELHHFYAALAPGENFDSAPAAPAPAPAPAPVPTLLYSKAKIFYELKFMHMLKLFCLYDSVQCTVYC